ncbi:MAG TPA: 4-hydroxyproline epimerase [Chloroflexota bacterium]|nr:4-hydroxyproline epimerase [Chloroflexota bacterium]
MRFKRLFTAIDSHTVGEPARIIVGGIPYIPGDTMFDKKRYIEEQRDDIRQLLMYEPRGHSSMSGAIITAPTTPGADVGLVFIEVSGCLPMCGHDTIAACTVLLETGILPAKEPVTELVLDTPAGIVRAQVEVSEGGVRGVTFENVPSYLALKDAEVVVPGIGRIVADISYGGNFYAILPAETVAVPIEPQHAGEFVRIGRKIRSALNEKYEVVHPENPMISGVSHVMFTGPATNPEATVKNTVIYGPSGMDRSPCGTGTSARMAQLHARGELPLKRQFVHESIIGSLFYGKLVREAKVGEFPAVVPTIRGRAFISGFNTIVLDPEDPFPNGFLLG